MAEESKGLFESIAELSSTLISAAHTRLALLSTDLEEDRAHLFSLVLLYIAAVFFLMIGLVLAVILLALVLWESHRVFALSAVAVFFLVLGALVWAVAMYKVKTKPKLFSSSLSVLLKDKDSLDAR